MSKTMIPQLRVEKSGNKNKDDFRVLLAGIIMCILLIFGQRTYLVLHDTFIAERPFITATIEVVHVDQELNPLILYDADPNQNVKGMWIASVYHEDGTRLTSRRGMGNYRVVDDLPGFWAWEAFFNNEQSDPPAIPEEPFYVCVRFDVMANDTQVTDSTEDFCSNTYDPKNQSTTIREVLSDGIIR